MKLGLSFILFLLSFFCFFQESFAENISQRIYKIYFSGNSVFSEQELRRFSRLRVAEEFREDVLVDSVARIKEAYYEQGYLNANVEISVDKTEDPDVRIYCSIKENVASRIRSVEIKGELPVEANKKIEKIAKDAEDQLYSENNLKNLKLQFLVALRNEGYLQAEVLALEVDNVENSSNKNLHYQIVAKEPITINFVGNNLFSPAELLYPLRLNSRTFPFAPTAISSLIREIRAMYESQGYFFAKVDFQELAPEGKRKIYQINIEEGKQVFLRDLSFSGNTKFSNDNLENLMQTKPKGWFLFHRWSPVVLSKEILANDLLAIEDFYNDAGYPNVKTSYKIIPTDDDAELDLEIDVVEDGEDRSEDIFFSYKESSNLSNDLKAQIEEGIVRGELLSEKIIQEQRERILKLLKERGYLNAKVDIEFEGRTSNVNIQIDPGVIIRIGKVGVAGNYFIDQDLILVTSKLEASEILLESDLKQAEEALYRTGFFRSVEISPVDGALDSASEDLIIKVVERDTGNFQLGLNLNSEEGLHILSEVGQKNLWKSGKAVTLGVDGFVRNGQNVFDAGTMKLGIASQDIFGSGFDHFVELFARYSLQLVDSYSYDRVGYSSNFRRKLAKDLNLGIFYSVFQEKLYDVPEDIIISNIDIDTKRLAVFNGQLDWDKRDSLYNARKGSRTLLQARSSTEAMGSTVNFYGFSAQQSVYFPLLIDLVWANNVNFTLLEPFSDTDVIPLSQRLFLGGRDSLRGFSRNAIGPRGFEGDIVGGDRSLNMRSEFQLDFSETLIGVMFLDAGQVFLRNQGAFVGDKNNFNDLRFSPGFGFRYRTPIGPISAEYGFALDRENGERLGRFNFGIGTGF